MSDREFELELAVVLALKDPLEELPREGARVIYARNLRWWIGNYFRGQFVQLGVTISKYPERMPKVTWWAYLPEVPKREQK